MSEPRGIFTDFIPEGQEEGSAYGEGGYRDYVPAPEPKEEVETPSKKRKNK